MPEKHDWSAVEGLPKGAYVQIIRDTPYVYFRYKWVEDGKVKQARDYLGVIRENKFVPNDYYLRLKPTKENRPSERWTTSPSRKAAAEKREQAGKEQSEVSSLSVGVTALAAMLLKESGLPARALDALGGNEKDAVDALNLAMAAAITAKPTYLSADESDLQMFIGGKRCLSSPRASEFNKRIGAGRSLSALMTKSGIASLEAGTLLALDGTKINCESKGILDAGVGKRKDGTFGSQINFSLIVNAENGCPVGYRCFGGSTADVMTINDFATMWDSYGLSSRDPVIVVDRGYYNQENFVALNRGGYKFLACAKTSVKIVSDVIKERNSEFYAASALMNNSNCYGVHDNRTLHAASGSMDLDVCVFRNPVQEMHATRDLRKRLDSFEDDWLQGKTEDKGDLLRFFESPRRGQPLVRDSRAIDEECFLCGYFAFVTNAYTNLENALGVYHLRNEAEVAFRLMFGHLLRSTRVHSSQALEGLLFTVFIALGILTQLRVKMRELLGKNSVSSSFTIREILTRLKRIQIVSVDGGKTHHLNNVTEQDRKLVEALGYPGLLDSASSVLEALSEQSFFR